MVGLAALYSLRALHVNIVLCSTLDSCVPTLLRSCWLRPGHHTACRALSIHLLISWWPLWNLSKISKWSTKGIIILLTFNNSSSLTVISDATEMHGCTAQAILCRCGHPLLQY